MKTPGVYVEEVPIRTPIVGAPTVTAFVGLGGSGPIDTATRVRMLNDFDGAFADRGADDQLRRAVSLFFANGGQDAWIVAASSLPSAVAANTGFHALDAVAGLSLLVLPGLTDPAVQAAAVAYGEARGAFVLLDVPASATDRSAVEAWLAGAAATRRPNAAAYLPLLPAPAGAPATASSGAVAGVMLRVENSRGIWKAAAGLDASVNGARDVPSAMGKADLDSLALEGVNPLRRRPDGGIVVWGARTLASGTAAEADWKYVPVRRLALFLEQSLEQSLQWTVFSPSDAPLWATVQQAVETFLYGLFQQGAFLGRTPREAFFARCGVSTMTPDDIENGRLIVEIGFAPLRPAEFVIVRIGLRTESAPPASPPAPPVAKRPMRPRRRLLPK